MAPDEAHASEHTTNKERRRLRMDTIALPAIVILGILIDVSQMIQNGIVSTRLSPAIEGGIQFAEIAGGAQWLYAIGFSLKYLALIVTSLAVSLALSNVARGRIFNQKNERLFYAGASGIFVYYISRLTFEGLANNWVASDLGLEQWWDTGAGTPSSELAPPFILGYALLVAALVIKRGIKLQEDVDGLV